MLFRSKQTILRPDVTLAEAIENIDIGGPTMLRAAAKNWQDVCVVVDPLDYDVILTALRAGSISKGQKFTLSQKVFEHTAHYDALIARYLAKQAGIEYPPTLTVTFEKAQDLRYGENPHQSAAFYRVVGRGFDGTTSAFEQLHGKELSYNNLNLNSTAVLIALKKRLLMLEAIIRLLVHAGGLADNGFTEIATDAKLLGSFCNLFLEIIHIAKIGRAHV